MAEAWADDVPRDDLDTVVEYGVVKEGRNVRSVGSVRRADIELHEMTADTVLRMRHPGGDPPHDVRLGDTVFAIAYHGAGLRTVLWGKDPLHAEAPGAR